jgi:exopolysaccharide production protein ExoZ
MPTLRYDPDPMKTAENEPSGRAIDTDLQILRAVAALLVLVGHAAISLNGVLGRPLVYVGWVGMAGRLGALGVGAFFVLSGYIMLETNRQGFRTARASLAFLLHRLLRIAPTYYVGTAAAFAALVFVAGKSPSFADLLRSLAFIPFHGDLEGHGFFPVLGVGWTLNMEMFFYLLFAVCLLLTPRFGTLLLAAILATLVVGGHLLERRGVIGEASVLVFYAKSTMLLFAAGMLLSLYRPRIAALYASLPWRPGFHTCFWAVIALVATYQLRASTVWELADKLTEAASLAIVLPAIFGGIAMSGRVRAAFIWIGDASYSLYVFHTIALLLLSHAFRAAGAPWPAAYLPLAIGVGLGGGLAGYVLVEQPLRERLERPLRRRIDARLRPERTIAAATAR